MDVFMPCPEGRYGMALATTECFTNDKPSRTAINNTVKFASGFAAPENNESTSNGGYRSGEAKQEAGSA